MAKKLVPIWPVWVVAVIIAIIDSAQQPMYVGTGAIVGAFIATYYIKKKNNSA